VRGNATQVYDKYLNSAKDAATAGDRVLAESLYQHAEHYQRILSGWQDYIIDIIDFDDTPESMRHTHSNDDTSYREPQRRDYQQTAQPQAQPQTQSQPRENNHTPRDQNRRDQNRNRNQNRHDRSTEPVTKIVANTNPTLIPVNITPPSEPHTSEHEHDLGLPPSMLRKISINTEAQDSRQTVDEAI
jgi:hypothetical protein